MSWSTVCRAEVLKRQAVTTRDVGTSSSELSQVTVQNHKEVLMLLCIMGKRRVFVGWPYLQVARAIGCVERTGRRVVSGHKWRRQAGTTSSRRVSESDRHCNNYHFEKISFDLLPGQSPAWITSITNPHMDRYTYLEIWRTLIVAASGMMIQVVSVSTCSDVVRGRYKGINKMRY
jgi:hypothetical protein